MAHTNKDAPINAKNVQVEQDETISYTKVVVANTERIATNY